MKYDESPPYAGNEDTEEIEHYTRNVYYDSWWETLYKKWDFEED